MPADAPPQDEYTTPFDPERLRQLCEDAEEADPWVAPREAYVVLCGIKVGLRRSLDRLAAVEAERDRLRARTHELQERHDRAYADLQRETAQVVMEHAIMKRDQEYAREIIGRAMGRKLGPHQGVSDQEALALTTVLREIEAERDTFAAQVQGLREALLKYGAHQPPCPHRPYGNTMSPCRCGLADAKERYGLYDLLHEQNEAYKQERAALVAAGEAPDET